MLVCSFINLRNYFVWQSAGDATNCLLALLFATILMIYPVFVMIFYGRRNYHKVLENDSEFNERFGSVISELNFKRRGRWALLYPCLTMLRKMWLAYILIF